jgi:DNA polymerase III delta prime subunit
MSKFINSLIPSKLDELHFNRNLIKLLKNLITDINMSNILIFGPSKSGKKTILNATIKEIFDFTKLKEYTEALKINNVTLNVSYLCSSNHFIINPSKYNLYDKYIITYLIKIISKTKNFDNKRKIIVIDDVYLLSSEAQQSLRRTMEIYSSNCKFILLSRKVNRIIQPIKSRCQNIRCALPRKEELNKRLNDLNQEFKLKLNQTDKDKILDKCNLNFESLYLIIDMIYNLKIPINEIRVPEDKVKDLALIIINSKNLTDFLKFKELLTKIIVDNIGLNDLICNILKHIMEVNLSIRKKFLCIEQASECEYKINKCSKEIFHLEYFIIKLYQIINDLDLD